MIKQVFTVIFGIASLFPLGLLADETSTQVDGYTIHHNALTTDFLTPDIARAYNIQRSKNRGLLNVSVIQNVDGQPGKAVSARVTATAKNLIGQSRDVPLREVREQNAIYYIGDFLVGHREQLKFSMEVKPAGTDEKYAASMSRKFYTD